MLFAVSGLELGIGLGIVVAILAVWQPGPVKKIFAAFGAQFAKLGRVIWSVDPVAVYQKQVDDAAEEIRHGTSGLEQYRGLVTQYDRKVEAGRKKVAVYQARAKLHAQANRDKEAMEAISAQKNAQAELDSDERLLTGYRTSYENNLKKIKYAQDKINGAREEASKLQAELRMSKVEAETAKLAQSFNVNSGAINSLGEVRDEIQRQIDTNRAKAQVATDLSNDGLADIEAEEALRMEDAAADLQKLKEEMKKV